MDIINYFQFIFQLLIISGGVIAVLVLTFNGVLFVVSTGKPEKIKEARSRILSAFLGLILLSSCWLILYSINPQLVEFSLPDLKQNPSAPLIPPSSYVAPGDLLTRIKNLAEKIKELTPEIEDMAEDIKYFTDECKCENTKAVCLCTGGTADSWCQPHKCYAGPGGDEGDFCNEKIKRGYHPCTYIETIKQLQSSIIDYGDVLLYYENRTIAEWHDLQDNITFYLNVKIEYYSELLKKESNEQGPNAELLTELLNKTLAEKENKEKLIEKLSALGLFIADAKEPITKLSELPDQCLENVNEKCESVCKTTSDYGCHNRTCGCTEEKCRLIDPDDFLCPGAEIEKQLGKIKKITPEILKNSEEIIDIINNISQI